MVLSHYGEKGKSTSRNIQKKLINEKIYSSFNTHSDFKWIMDSFSFSVDSVLYK